MTDVSAKIENAPKEEEVVVDSEPVAEALAEDAWAPAEGVKTKFNDWSPEDWAVFHLQDFGDTILLDEDGQSGWSGDLVSCELRVDPSVTSAMDFVKMVRADAEGGQMTVEDIFNKYCVGSY